MNNWFKPIDIYCERLDAGWWAEPVNALTNLAFVIAGLIIVRHRQHPGPVLGWLMVTIGIGSFLFHTHANRLTGLIDVTFIGVYLATYAWLWPRIVWHKGAMPQALSVASLATFIVLATLLNQVIERAWPEVPPGVYTGAWLYVMTLAILCNRRQPAARTWLWITAGLFLGSLTARQLDMPLCPVTGGTHWLWHVLNAGVLYASARAMLAATKTDATN